MYIKIEKAYYTKEIKPKFSKESQVNIQAESNLRYGSTEFELPVMKLEWEELISLYGIAKNTKNRSLMMQISAFRNLLEDVENTKITNLKALIPALVSYLTDDLIDGWLYKIKPGTNGSSPIPNPYLVTNMSYHPAMRKDERASVRVKMVANTYSAYSNNSRGSKVGEVSMSFDSDDIQGKTIPELLAYNGYYHENEELKGIYDEHTALFDKYQPLKNEQFLINGYGYSDERYGIHEELNLNSGKAVNDEGLLSRSFTPLSDPSFWRKNDVETGFTNIPFHSYIYFFHLDLHKNIWVHVSNMKPYVFDKTLRDKLILPDSHKDLIDILVEDMGILQEDIIKGKSGGTTILSVGEPGLGKTLSAEVYSEVIEKPLYKVHSGQLGTGAEEVQKNLEEILKRASRWGAVLLLDEADVYIRIRGNDIEHNAVVASFLRTLEYFSGLLFMTTNRGDDVDDAIRSRCIAIIKYDTPSKSDALKLWKVLSTQFKIDLTDSLISDLTGTFPTASGRDIKELLKLSSRFAKGKGRELTLEVFKQCAQFRGVVIRDI